MPAVHEVSRAPLSERGADFYATCYPAIAVLLQAEGKRIPKCVWEPNCGSGAIVLPFRNRGYKVVATDLHDWQCPDSETGQEWDIEIATAPKGIQGAIANPPFKLAFESVNAMVRQTPYVAAFLPLTFLESNQRNGWFSQIGLSRMHIITDRLPTMHRMNWQGPKIKNSRKCFAWFIIDRRKGKRKASWETAQWSWKEAVKLFPMRDEDLPPSNVEAILPLFKEAASASGNQP